MRLHAFGRRAASDPVHHSVLTSCAALLLVLALGLGALGCGNSPAAAGSGNTDAPPSGPSLTPPAPPPPLLVISPDQVESVLTHPRWSLDFDRPVTASISADGKHVLVGRSFISSGVEYFSAVLYGADGKQVWTKTYREDRYRTIQVSSPGAGGHFGVALFTYNNPGIAYLYNAQGQRLWSRSVTSSATLVLDPGTLALYGIDHGKRELFSASVSTGQSRNLGTISERSSLELGGGSLLVTDMSTAMLLGTDGSLVLRQPVPADFTGLSLAPDGSAVYAATRGADSSVLRLNERGGVSWSTRIPAAGSNSIIVSPTGRYVLVFNITLDSGFVVLDAADGSILCRNTFAPVEDTASQFIRWARFLPEDDAVLIDYAVSRSRPSGHVEEHSLLLFSMAGELRARFNAGANVDLLVSDDGRACVTVSTVAYDWSGPTPNRVRFYDLTPTFGLRRP